MEIIIEPHTIIRIKERGATEEEVIETLENGNDIIGKYGRLGKENVFLFNRLHGKKYYEEKKLEVYYIVKDERIVTVTVYVFFGKFKL